MEGPTPLEWWGGRGEGEGVRGGEGAGSYQEKT